MTDPAERDTRVHNHPPYRPLCNERRLPDGSLRGACLPDHDESWKPTIYHYDPVCDEDAGEEMAGVTKGYIVYRPESGSAFVADAAILVGDDGEKRYQVMSDFRPTQIVDNTEGKP